MIDWVKVRIPYPHTPITGGSILVIDRDGEVTREQPLAYDIPGSHDSRIRVSSWGSLDSGTASHLVICGNPSKFLQGHNVVGSDDISMLVRSTYHSICSTLQMPAFEYSDSEVMLTWVDINYMYQLSSLAEVRAWLAAAEFSARSRAGRAVMTGSTVYLQKHSRRWAMKFYSKYDEFAVNPLPDGLQCSGLVAFSENLLRAELRIFRKELEKIRIKYLSDLTPSRVKNVFGEYMRKIIMTERVRLPRTETMEFPSSIRGTYELWYSGHDMREHLSRPTFYRHRKMLLEHGIDISMAAPIDKPSNVVPLIRTITASEIQIPAWIYERNLVAGGN